VFVDNAVEIATKSSFLKDILILATDHVDLLKGKVEIEKDALTEAVKPAEPEKFIDKDTDDDLVNMMGGLGIEAKCAICFTMYLLPKQN
jgi:hypothetical protein